MTATRTALLDQTKETCSGPQDAKVTYQVCTSCGAPDYVALDSDYDRNLRPQRLLQGAFLRTEVRAIAIPPT